MNDSGLENGWFTRDRLRLLVLLGATLIVAHICFRLAEPFLPALTWALALAVIAYPLHDRVSRRVQRPDLAAGLSVAIVAVVLIGPAALIGQQIISQGTGMVDRLQENGGTSSIRESLSRNSKLGPLAGWIEQHIDIERELKNLAAEARERTTRTIKGTVAVATQFLICLFALFFFFRDHRQVMTTLHSMVPLSSREVDEVFTRIRDMVHATIYGTVVVAFVQGALGGLMFWILGLPMPLLWGVAMALLALIPVLGAFVIWGPAAAWLLIDGSIAKAAILTAWGTLVVGLIDNLLYPMLVGKEMRLHTLPVFLAIVGGLFVFGASGIVLGPVALVLLLALIDILRRRTVAGRPAEKPV